MTSARFIAFEGGEGAGKSTQIARLAARLRSAGETVVETREPGGTAGAEVIRGLFVQGEPGRWTAQTDALLVTAARADHVARRIRPALRAGAIVLCDRYVHSTLAYQGHGRGLDMEALVRMHRFATGDLWPDAVFWLDLPVEVGLARSTRRAAALDPERPAEQRFEQLDQDFHQRVRSGFSALAAADRRIVRIDAMMDIDAVEQAIAATPAVAAPGQAPAPSIPD